VVGSVVIGGDLAPRSISAPVPRPPSFFAILA
jgi:hypothetical protein